MSIPPPTLPLAWNAEPLRQRLQPLWPGLEVEAVERIGSTNAALLERARGAGGFSPCLLVAEHQTAGRGRLGRAWQSARGASLTFSLGLPLDPVDWSGLSLAVGAALADALDPPTTAAPRLGLKWPNDLWLRDDACGLAGRKLGGVLIETVMAGSRRCCVIGIGLNVAPQALDGLGTGFACLQELDPAATAPGTLDRVAAPLLLALRRFEAEGFAGFSAGFGRRDLLSGRAVSTTLADLPRGTAHGVDDGGRLRLHGPGGAVHWLVGGEVSVRPASEGVPAC